MWSGADASYLTAITAAAREYTWHGTVVDADGTSYSFTASDIVAGSGQINRVVSSATSLDIGTVYASELSIRLFLNINRYKLYNGSITLYCDVNVSGTTYSVPMGVYTISECTQELSCIAIKAYDAMTKFDSVTVKEDQGTVTPYNWISYICGLAGVTLGTSQADINAMPNGTTALPFTFCDTKLNEITCRDALAFLCGALCANAYIGRDGNLYIQQYGMNADDDIAANERISSSLSDFTTNYTGISLKIYATGNTEYYAESVDDGLTLELGANPWLQSGSDAERETACRNIIDSLTTVSYTPYSASLPLRPELDPMDVLTFSGNQASSDIGAITSLSYKLGGSMTVKCTGANPRLIGVKSKTEKALEALTSTVAKEINQMSVVQNASAVTIAESTETSILSYAFEVTSSENTTMIDVSVVLTASATETENSSVYTLSDIVAALSFYVDNSQVTVYGPEFIIDEGKDTMTFNYSLSGLSVGAHEFDVRLTMGGGTGSIATGDVHELLWGYGITFEVYAKSIEIDTSGAIPFYYVGQALRYYGVRVDAIYNNGQRNDVTADCTFDPALGTITTVDDIGTHTVYVEYDEFGGSFEITVTDVSISLNSNYSSSNVFACPNIIRSDGTAVRFSGPARLLIYECLYDEATYYKPYAVEIGNYTPTDSNTLTANVANGMLINGSNTIVYNGTQRDLAYYDFDNQEYGLLTVTFDVIDHAGTSLYKFYSVRLTVDDQYILFPMVDITYNDGDGNVVTTGYAVGTLNGHDFTIHVHIGEYLPLRTYSENLVFPTAPRYAVPDGREKKFYTSDIVGYQNVKYAAKKDGDSITIASINIADNDVSISDVWTAPFSYTPNLLRYNSDKDTMVVGYADASVVDAYIVNMQSLEYEHVTSDDPAQNDFYNHVVGKNVMYNKYLGQYISVNNDSYTYAQTFYVSGDLVNWDAVTLTPRTGGAYSYKLGESMCPDPHGFWLYGRRTNDNSYTALAFTICYSLEE